MALAMVGYFLRVTMRRGASGEQFTFVIVSQSRDPTASLCPTNSPSSESGDGRAAHALCLANSLSAPWWSKICVLTKEKRTKHSHAFNVFLDELLASVFLAASSPLPPWWSKMCLT